MIKCTCWFCTRKQPHPDGHESFHEISGLLLIRESLDPNDVIRREACTTCGHVREKV